MDPQENLDRPALHPLPDQLLQGRLHRPKLVTDLGTELEMPVVDCPDLHQERPLLVLLPSLSKTGHAQEQGSLAGSWGRSFQIEPWRGARPFLGLPGPVCSGSQLATHNYRGADLLGGVGGTSGSAGRSGAGAEAGAGFEEPAAAAGNGGRTPPVPVPESGDLDFDEPDDGARSLVNEGASFPHADSVRRVVTPPRNTHDH